MHNTPIESFKIHLIMRFDRSKKWQRFFAGTEIHVDALLHEPLDRLSIISYTAYMHEKFSSTLMGRELAESRDHVNIAIAIDQDECTRMQDYFSALVDRVAYNYKDLMLAMGFMGHGTFMNTMCEDIDGSDPTTIKQVYCSQAMVLMMRYCLNPDSNAELLKEINALNSRAVTPHALFNVIKRYGKECTGESLTTNELQFTVGLTPHDLRTRN